MRYIASWFEVFAIEASSGCTSVVTRAECARIMRKALRLRWRIIFRFDDGDVYDVDLVDYH